MADQQERDWINLKPDGTARHAATAGVLKHFRYQHLPAHLQEISRAFADLAVQMADKLPEGADLTHGLRNLLAAKDDCVRARIF